MSSSARQRLDEVEGHLSPLAWFAALVVAALLVPHTPATGVIICPMLALTDILCPGCGMTRSVTAFVRGDVEASVINNIFGPLLIVGLAWVSALRVGDRVAKKPVWETGRLWWARWSTPIWLTILFVLFAYWAGRLAGVVPEPL